MDYRDILTIEICTVWNFFKHKR